MPVRQPYQVIEGKPLGEAPEAVSPGGTYKAPAASTKRAYSRCCFLKLMLQFLPQSPVPGYRGRSGRGLRNAAVGPQQTLLQPHPLRVSSSSGVGSFPPCLQAPLRCRPIADWRVSSSRSDSSISSRRFFVAFRYKPARNSSRLSKPCSRAFLLSLPCELLPLSGGARGCLFRRLETAPS